MSRYIDAEWLKQNFNTVFWSQVAKTIDSAPSIDIVRCKECGKRMREDCPMCNCCKLDRVPTEDDDFCSYGERKEQTERSE